MVKKLGGTNIIGAALIVSALILGRGAVAATFTYNDDPVPGGMCGCGSCNCIMVPTEEADIAVVRRPVLLSLLSKKQLAVVAEGATLSEEKAIKAAATKTTTSAASAGSSAVGTAAKTTAISSGSTVTKSAASAGATGASSASKTTSSAPTESLVSSSGSGSSGSSGSSKTTSAASAGSSVVGSAASKTTTSNTNTSASKLESIHDSKESAQIKATGGTESLVSSGGSSAASKGSTAAGSAGTKATNSSGSPDDRSSNSSLVSGGSSGASSGGSKSSTQTLQDIHDKQETAAIKAQGLPQDTSTGKTSGTYNYGSEAGRIRVSDNNTDYRSLFLDSSRANLVAPEVKKSSYSPDYFKGEDWRLSSDPTGKTPTKTPTVTVPIIFVGDYTVEKAVIMAQRNDKDDGMYYEYNKPDGSKGYVNSKGFLVSDPTK